MRYITNITLIILLLVVIFVPSILVCDMWLKQQQDKQIIEMQIDALQWEKAALQQENATLRSEIDRMKQETSRGSNRRTMEITAYTAGPESTGKGPGHPEYGITAIGYRLSDADAWKVAAADPRYYPPGTRLNVAGVGTVTIVDTGSAIQGPYSLDIFVGMTNIAEANKWGRRNVQVVIER